MPFPVILRPPFPLIHYPVTLLLAFTCQYHYWPNLTCFWPAGDNDFLVSLVLGFCDHLLFWHVCDCPASALASCMLCPPLWTVFNSCPDNMLRVLLVKLVYSTSANSRVSSAPCGCLAAPSGSSCTLSQAVNGSLPWGIDTVLEYIMGLV